MLNWNTQDAYGRAADRPRPPLTGKPSGIHHRAHHRTAILLLVSLLCVGACSLEDGLPATPGIDGPTPGHVMGRPYPERWMAKRQGESGYNCFQCHEALVLPELPQRSK